MEHVLLSVKKCVTQKIDDQDTRHIQESAISETIDTTVTQSFSLFVKSGAEKRNL